MSDDNFLGMEQKSVQANHEEALELAHLKKSESNLARCYLAMMAERDQWKANHDNQVALKAIIMQRPDLKERADLVMGLVLANNNLLLQLRNRDEVINAAEKTLRSTEDAYMQSSDAIAKLQKTGHKAIGALCAAGFTLKDEESEWTNWPMQKIQGALGNGADENKWPPGTDWVDAACKIIKTKNFEAARLRDALTTLRQNAMVIAEHAANCGVISTPAYENAARAIYAE